MEYKSYDNADQKSRIEYLNSRSEVVSKSDIADLWARVIEKAIDDIVRYGVLKEKYPNRKLTEEEQNKIDAESFLFNENHLIAFDDYIISFFCPYCTYNQNTTMSNLASGVEMCRNCFGFCSEENIGEYTIEKIDKEINLKELLLIAFSLKDIDSFRDKVRKKIEKNIKAKLNG
jgi:hypothetical protein